MLQLKKLKHLAVIKSLSGDLSWGEGMQSV